jgi:hypothetical protein
MKRTWTCLPLAIAGALALGACTGDATRSDVTWDEPEERVTAPAPEPRVATPAPSSKRTTTPAPAPSVPAPVELEDDELVGVEACDDYLESYKSCHRVIGIYAPDTIESRYGELRARLVAQGRDPANHDGLRLQCESLGADMKTTLDGRDCPDEPEIADVPDLDDEVDDTLESVVEDENDRP